MPKGKNGKNDAKCIKNSPKEPQNTQKQPKTAPALSRICKSDFTLSQRQEKQFFQNSSCAVCCGLAGGVSTGSAGSCIAFSILATAALK